MHILALILGILSLVLFSWLGPTIGAGAAAPSAEDMASGSFEVSTGAGYVWGILIGVVIPLLAAVFGFMGMKKSKGMAITGLVLGILGAILGAILTFVFVGAVGAMGDLAGGMQGMANDPATQQMLQQGLDQAMQDAMQQAGQAGQQMGQ